jgi:hypothetical protein
MPVKKAMTANARPQANPSGRAPCSISATTLTVPAANPKLNDPMATAGRGSASESRLRRKPRRETVTAMQQAPKKAKLQNVAAISLWESPDRKKGGVTAARRPTDHTAASPILCLPEIPPPEAPKSQANDSPHPAR